MRKLNVVKQKPLAAVDATNALTGVTFDLAVGQTGSGKSTISKLLNRIYDVDNGRILIDGVDVRNWDLASLRRQVSIIGQDHPDHTSPLADSLGGQDRRAAQGRVAAVGTHEELMEQSAAYRDIFAAVVSIFNAKVQR